MRGLSAEHDAVYDVQGNTSTGPDRPAIMKKMPDSLLIIVFGVLFSAGASAEIYQWVDENGVTQFSERRPQADVPVATVETTHSQATKTRETWQEREAAFKERTETASKAAAERAKADAEAAAKRANCEAARKRATSLQRPRINEVKEDGTRVRIGEDQRQAEIKKANDAIAEFCE